MCVLCVCCEGGREGETAGSQQKKPMRERTRVHAVLSVLLQFIHWSMQYDDIVPGHRIKESRLCHIYSLLYSCYTAAVVRCCYCCVVLLLYVVQPLYF